MSLSTSITHLLTKAHSVPCSTAAHAFFQLVQPHLRFTLALEALLPVLCDSRNGDTPQRILVSFILYALYAPHPIAINPFKAALCLVFEHEREYACQVAGTTETPGNNLVGNVQLVQVLWKILKGEGEEISPYSPTTLARPTLPPNLLDPNLSLSDLSLSELPYLHLFDSVEAVYNPTTFSYPPLPTSTSSTSSATHSKSSSSHSNVSRPSSTTSFRSAPQSLQEEKEETEAEHRNVLHASALVTLLDARHRVLTLQEARIIRPVLVYLISQPFIYKTKEFAGLKMNPGPLITSTDILPIITLNPSIAYSLILSLLASSPSTEVEGKQRVLAYFPIHALTDILTSLPPNQLSTFDLLGRLLRDQSQISSRPNHPSNGHSSNTNGHVYPGTEDPTVASIIHTHVLGPFISSSIKWLDEAEEGTREGKILDDRWAMGVRNLCRFYLNLIKLSLIDPMHGETSADFSSAEMAHFSLRNARFEEANLCYRALVMGAY